MGSKRSAKNVLSNGSKGSSSTPQTPAQEEEEFISEEEYRKQFEPVAPWKRKNIPDYGPLHDTHHVLIFIAIGILSTLFYEFTDYFDQIHRVFAYIAIWFPLWFRLLSTVSPALSDEELEAREKLEFQKELDRLAREEDQVDE